MRRSIRNRKEMKMSAKTELSAFYLSDKIPSNTHITDHNEENEHSHDFIEAAIIVTGKIKHSFGNRQDVFDENEIIIMPLDKVHKYTRFPEIDCQHRDIMLDPHLVAQIFREHFTEIYDLLFVKHTFVHSKLDYESFTAINYYTDIITKKNIITKELHLSATIGLIFLLGTIFSGKMQIDKEKHIPECVRRIILAVESHQIFHYSWREIYNLSTYSKEYTCRKFRSVMNCTITEYINQAKVNYAADLLANTFLSTNQILDKINISSETYFLSLFKKQFHCTPFQYRKNRMNPV